MSTARYEAVKTKRWENVLTGQTASVYGAAPYYSEEHKKDWRIVETGAYSLRDNERNTIRGNPYPPYEWTREEVEAIIRWKENQLKRSATK